MADPYTPTTEWVRIMVGYAKTTATDRTLPTEAARAEGYEWFDRWLIKHDKQVAEKAWREGVQAHAVWAASIRAVGFGGTPPLTSPYAK